MTMRQLRVLIAHGSQNTRELHHAQLPELGHEIVGEAVTGAEVVALCTKLKPDLVVASAAFADMTGIEAAELMYEIDPVAIILISDHYDQTLIDQHHPKHVLAYLATPLKPGELHAAIAVAMSSFQDMQDLRAEAKELRQALKDRKIIEKAKGILMQRAGVSEQDAFTRLQKLSWDRNEKLVKIAEMIILADGAIAPFEKRIDTPAKQAQSPTPRKNGAGRHYLGRGMGPHQASTDN